MNMSCKIIVLLIIVKLLNNFECVAQITFEHSYSTIPGEGNNFCITNLGNENYKYVLWDSYNAKFSLYNLDHTPFMLNISIPVSDSGAYYNIGYITSSLFDCDSTNIEFAIIGNGPDPSKAFYIYRTDGTLIFSRDSVTTTWCVGCFGGSTVVNAIKNTPSGTKLYLVNNINGLLEFYVYSLCGTLPENITEMNQSDAYVRTFPNPATRQINFEITAPSNYDEYELTIFNSAFQPIKIIKIKNLKSQITIDVEYFNAGVYYYSLQNKNKIFQTGKFVLSK